MRESLERTSIGARTGLGAIFEDCVLVFGWIKGESGFLLI